MKKIKIAGALMIAMFLTAGAYAQEAAKKGNRWLFR